MICVDRENESDIPFKKLTRKASRNLFASNSSDSKDKACLNNGSCAGNTTCTSNKSCKTNVSCGKNDSCSGNGACGEVDVIYC